MHTHHIAPSCPNRAAARLLNVNAHVHNKGMAQACATHKCRANSPALLALNILHTSPSGSTIQATPATHT